MKTASRCVALFALVVVAACPGENNSVAGPNPPAPPPPPPPAPGAPSNLVTEFVSSSRIDLRWVDNATDEDGYRVERCAGTSCGSFAVLSTLPAGHTATIDVGLTGSTTYRYRVQAYNNNGSSTYAGPVSATTLPAATPPAAPANLVATYVSLNRVDLSWNDIATNEDEYDLERCTGAGCTNFVKFAVTLPNATSYQANAPLQPSTTYRYRVYALNGAGSSSALTATVTTPTGITLPAAPANFAATAVSSSQINLSWTDQATNETGYHIERCTGATCANYAPLADGAANANSFTNGSLAAGTTYRYRIQAFNTAGVSTTIGPATATTQSVTAPAAPTNLTATTVSSSRIDLSWTDASNNEDSFKIDRCIGAGCSTFMEIQTLAAGTTSYANTGLAASTAYSYRVRSFNTGGAGTSNTASATTHVVLSAPTLNTPSVSGATITLTWSFTWPGGLAGSSDRYVLEQSTTSSTSGFAEILSEFTHTTPFTTTLTRTTGTYYFRVRAVTQQGTSPNSAVQSAVIASPAPPKISLRNNLSGTGGNQVLRFRVAATTSALYNAATAGAERLSPDNYCGGLPGEAVDPGETQVFDLSADAPNYVVYIGLGKWDNTTGNGTTCWQKKNFAFDINSGHALYLYTAISWQGHSGGTNQWTIMYDSQNRIILRTSSGDIAFVVSTDVDPIR